jgi:hypothetical protein
LAKNKKKSAGKARWLDVQLATLTNAQYKSQTYRQGLLLGQSVGVLALILGSVFSLGGVAGRIDWIVSSAGLTSRLTNATPGVFFVFVGMVIIMRYKPRVSNDIQFDRDRVGYTSVLHNRLDVGGLQSWGGESPSPRPSRERISIRDEQRNFEGPIENRASRPTERQAIRIKDTE